MRARSLPSLLVVVFALLLVAAACGDDDASDDESAAVEDTTDPDAAADTSTTAAVEATGDPGEPCTLLVEDDFDAALGASVSEPADVTGNFGFGGSATGEFAPQACQWQATTTDAGGITSFSVEVITVVGPEATEVYDGELDFAESFSGITVEPVELPGDRAVAFVDDGEPEIVVQAGELAVKVSTASDDLPVEDLAALTERALRRAGIS